MAELTPEVRALLQRMEAFLADPNGQTLEAANAIYNDPSYRELLRSQIRNPTVARFLSKHVDLQRPVAIQRLKDEIARRQSKGK